MKSLILLALTLLTWATFIYFYKLFSISHIPILFMNSLFRSFPQHPQINIPKNQPRGLLSDIREDLYNSISTGMSYDEVIAIIGWEGILIYQNDIDSAEGRIHEQVYQWSYQDVYGNDYDYPESSYINLYWSVTLQFHNNILIKKASFNLQP